MPRHAAGGELASAADALHWGGGPVVVKPRVSRGGRGVHVVEAADDPIWDALDDSGSCRSSLAGSSTARRCYRSPRTGAACGRAGEDRSQAGTGRQRDLGRRLPDDAAPDVAALARRTVETLDLVGPVDLDVRRLDDGTPVVLEVNARFGAVSTGAPELLDAVLPRGPAGPVP